MPRGRWMQHPTLLTPLDALAALAYRIAEFAGDEQAFIDPAACAAQLTAQQADFLLRAYFPWLVDALYSRTAQRKLQRGIEDLAAMVQRPTTRSNPWSRRRELAVGQREELEHTRSPRAARRIAEDHLREDPAYYEKLRRCGLVKPARTTRRNPSADILEQIVKERDREWYEAFHGVPPEKIRELNHAWTPGGMVLLGDAVDVGYRILDARSKKEVNQDYEHEHEAGVKAYRRTQKGERPTRTWRTFPGVLRVLGYNIGFSYADSNGDIHEVKGSRQKYLATDATGKLLAIVDPTGIEYILTGGSLIVKDWIHG